MTLRYSVNNLCDQTPLAGQVLFTFYNFMIAASPTGPGWTCVGASDGTTGGMGVSKANLTTLAQFTSQNCWFVLRAPDGSREILFHRDVGGTALTGEMYFLYNRGGSTFPYTGGSASSLPTATYGKQVYTNTAWIGGSGYFHFMADDAAPYGWAWFGYSGTTQRGSAAMLPVENAYASDVDKYVLTGNTANFSTAQINAYVPYTWSPTGLEWTTVVGLKYTSIPGSTPVGPDGTAVAVPVLFGRLATDVNPFTKGFVSLIRWCGTASITEKSTTSSGAFIAVGNCLLPWNAVEPL